MSKKHRLSLAEQIAQLADPRPSNFHPDEDEREQLGAVSLSYASEEDEGDHVQRSSLRVTSWEDDPRYTGRPVTRKELEQDDQEQEDYSADEESVLEESDDSLEDQSDVSPTEDVIIDQSNTSTHIVNEEVVEQPFPTLSAQSMHDELEKSHAVKHQTELWDKLLEARIHLHKVLPLSNKMPQYDMMPAFKKAGRTTLSDAISTNESSLRNLLDQLLELQQCLLHQNTETRTALQDEPDQEEDDEEILSDEAEGLMENDTQPVRIGKRQQRDWELRGRDYEECISGVHERLSPFVYDTIDKWNKRLRLTTEKATSKSFIQVDKSVVGQICHILLDKQRLVRRTQLKRSHYRVLGKYDTEKHDEQEDEDQVDDRDKSKDYSEEIFDDDDFYHQLLRNLIERRMNATESTDTIAMGRDWLQLQQLRSKVKRKSVDTKASKGRKLRYEVHQKLVSFMSPVEQGTMPDSARNDLFASLFGARSAAATRQKQ